MRNNWVYSVFWLIVRQFISTKLLLQIYDKQCAMHAITEASAAMPCLEPILKRCVAVLLVKRGVITVIHVQDPILVGTS